LQKLRVAVVGAGAFGRNHLRVLGDMPDAEIAAVVDTDMSRAESAAASFGCAAAASLSTLPEVDAVIVAVPTVSHAEVGCELLERGIDVLMEKPIAPDLPSARRLADTAARNGRILQVGHLERFNPAVTALAEMVTLPLFFEIHRMSVFTRRSLDVDVVLDLMIHDIDIVLSLIGRAPDEIRAAGISILSSKVDIAHVRLAFPGGCVANLTASRVSTERVRKLRLFQPGQYISVDYQRQDGSVFRVSGDKQIGFEPLHTAKGEPLRLEVASFLDCVRRRREPLVGAAAAVQALEVSLEIQKRIEEHAGVVAASVEAHAATAAL
jgi:predicted dehydrogenase